jgi:hypothetical protein
MTAAMAKDKAYAAAHDPNYPADYTTFKYWLQNADELFAEEFSIQVIGVYGTTQTVDFTINNYWKCSLYYTQYWMINGKAIPANGYPAYLSYCN